MRPLQWFPNLSYYFTLLFHFKQTAELFVCHIRFCLFLFHLCVFVCLSHLLVFISCSSSLIFLTSPSFGSNPISSKLSQLLIFGFSWMIKCFQNICTVQGGDIFGWKFLTKNINLNHLKKFARIMTRNSVKTSPNILLTGLKGGF